jgi:hypothetical protein
MSNSYNEWANVGECISRDGGAQCVLRVKPVQVCKTRHAGTQQALASSQTVCGERWNEPPSCIEGHTINARGRHGSQDVSCVQGDRGWAMCFRCPR